MTGEDLGQTPTTLEKTKFEYSPLGMSFLKAFEKDQAKSGTKSKSDFNYDKNHRFYKCYKGYDEFEDKSVDSKHNRMKKFNEIFTDFKNFKPKKAKTQFKKERIMKNVDELYKKYYDAYKDDYNTDDELNEAKKIKSVYKQFELVDNDDDSKVDGETKKLFLKEVLIKRDL